MIQTPCVYNQLNKAQSLAKFNVVFTLQSQNVFVLQVLQPLPPNDLCHKETCPHKIQTQSKTNVWLANKLNTIPNHDYLNNISVTDTATNAVI